MLFSAIRGDDDRVRVVECLLVLHPTLILDHHDEAGSICQAFLEEEAAGSIFVLARPMAGLAGDKDDLSLPSGVTPSRLVERLLMSATPRAMRAMVEIRGVILMGVGMDGIRS